MARFEGKIRKGRRVTSVSVQAKNIDEAKLQLKSYGRVLTLRKEFGFELNIGLTPVERQLFFARLSAMLSSKVGTSEALLLIRDTFKGRIQEVAGRLLRFVEGGLDLAEAFEKVGNPDFPETTVALIKAGIKSGESGRAIKDAATFERELAVIRKGASKGIWMGVGSLVFAGLVTIVSALYVGPQIMESPMIKMAKGVDISMIDTAARITAYIIAAILAVGFLGYMTSVVGRRVAPVSVDRFIMKIPFYKDLVLSKNNFITLYGLQLLVRSGVKIEEALRLTAEGANKGALRSDLIAASTAVKTGKPWPVQMQSFHPTDRAALLSAPDREQTANTLAELADQYKDLYAQRLATFVPALNMIAALFLSIAGGIMFGESILPMLMASSSGFG